MLVPSDHNGNQRTSGFEIRTVLQGYCGLRRIGFQVERSPTAIGNRKGGRPRSIVPRMVEETIE